MNHLKNRTYSGTLSSEISEREIAHRALARRAAAEGMVLLENDGVLPLAAGSSVALYGGFARYTIKGGTGSGSVNNRSNVSVEEGLRNSGLVITTDTWLEHFEQAYDRAKEAWMAHIYESSKPGDFFSLYTAYSKNRLVMPKGDAFEKTDADTAIYVIGRISGESVDRHAEKGDYYLSDAETEDLKSLAALYPKLIVILNVGGVIDLSFLDEIPVAALVLMSQAGMEGGNALADVLLGKVNPCGRLTDSWAYHYEDYPAQDTFGYRNGNLIQEKYTEGIYVGYRYFDSFEKIPRYPFGFGRSYTEFSYRTISVTIDDASIAAEVEVTNQGYCPGREVIQAYVSCPQEMRAKECKRLVAFAKTKELQAGESQRLVLKAPIDLLTSYHTAKASYYLEQGAYLLYVGTSAAAYKPAAVLTLEETQWSSRMDNICPLLDALTEIEPVEEMRARWITARLAEASVDNLPTIAMDAAAKGLMDGSLASDLKLAKAQPRRPQDEVMEEAKKVLAQMTPLQKAQLVCGQPSAGSGEVIGAAAVHVPGAAGETTGSLEALGVGEMILADGPAGLRLQQCYEVDPKDGSICRMDRYQSLQNRFFGTEFLHEGTTRYYQFCSAIPVGTLLAQSFDPELVEQVGRLIGVEMEEFGVDLWLAPGMNIHRNPLCGRNFEYYSEDPLVSGVMAAAITRGVQELPGIGTTIKHYACNNQEDNRMGVSSIVSERALREIYLKGFEIAIKTSQPKAIMTSYNRLNSVHTANSYDLCTIAARKEWGFDGIIMTDWLTTNDGHGSSSVKCVQAGNDLVMPGNESDILEIVDALEEKKDLSLKMEDLDACVLRMLKCLME